MDDLLQEPDGRTLLLCERHYEKWQAAPSQALTPTPGGPLVFCQGCKRSAELVAPEALADWITHQYGIGPVVGWLCPECRKNSDEAN